MEIPVNCPICNNSLVNTVNSTTDSVIYKNCRSSSDHIFGCAVFVKDFMGVKEPTLERVTFTLSMSPPLSVEIHPPYKTMVVGKCLPNWAAGLIISKDLPFYVEPDFSDYEKLRNKIKIYILFS